MNNWLNQLERKYGRFGIPNLTNILVGGQILVLAIELFVNQTVSVWLALSRYFLLRGQIWRIITFAFIPSYGGKYFGFFAAALWVLSFLGAPLPQKLSLLLSMANVWLFFGPMAYRSVRAWVRREQWKRRNRR